MNPSKVVILLFFVLCARGAAVEETQRCEINAQKAQRSGNHERAGHYYFKAAKAYGKLGNKEKSIESYIKSATEYEQEARQRGSHGGHAAVTCRKKAKVDEKSVDREKAYSKAVIECKQTIRRYTDKGDRSMVCIGYCTLGEIYEKQGNVDKARKVYKKATVEHEEGGIGDYYPVYDYYKNVAIAYAKLGNNEKARQMYLDAAIEFEIFGDHSHATEMRTKAANLPQTELWIDSTHQ
jgi:tetratricopeptide (TPR) repeat protein